MQLDGSVLHQPIAAFRVIPYLARKSVPLSENFVDIDTNRLHELEMTNDIDDDGEASTPSDDS